MMKKPIYASKDTANSIAHRSKKRKREGGFSEKDTIFDFNSKMKQKASKSQISFNEYPEI